MHSNLVSAAGIDPQFEQRELAKFGIDPPLYRVVRYGFASAGAASCHSRAADAVAADAAGNRAAVLFHPSVDERDVGLLHQPSSELRGQFAMRFVVFGDQNYSACGFVKAMNNARAEFASDGGELAKMMQQRVYQRAAIAGVIGRARAGVDHDARGLVDYREIVVFVDNFQRNFFRY